MKRMEIKRLMAGVLTALLTVTSVPAVQVSATDFQDVPLEALEEITDAKADAVTKEATEVYSEDAEGQGGLSSEDPEGSPSVDEETEENFMEDDESLSSEELTDDAEDAEAETDEGEAISDEDAATTVSDEEAKESSRLLGAADKITVNYYLYADVYPKTESYIVKTTELYAPGENKYPDYYAEVDGDFDSLMPGYVFCGWFTYPDYNLDYEDELCNPDVIPGETTFSAELGDVVNVYAHWKVPEIHLNVITGDNAEYEYIPYYEGDTGNLSLSTNFFVGAEASKT